MVSIKAKFRPSTVAGREGSIYYQIILNRKVRQLLTPYKVFPEEWNSNRAIVTLVLNGKRSERLFAIRQCILRDIERFKRIASKLDCDSFSYSVDDIIDEYNYYLSQYSISSFTKSIIARLKESGKIRTAETYQAALNSFTKFLTVHISRQAGDRKDDVMLDSITPELMESYESWLLVRGITQNSISFYTRILRAVYNRAVDNDIIDNRYPFRHVYTGIGKTVKRALPIKAISRIKGLDLTTEPKLDYARDMFLLSFYLRGMSFIDMAFLRKSDLSNSYLTYCRRKTGQRLTVKWTKEMQMILDKYPVNKSDYLLPIIKSPCKNERSVYRNTCYNINHNLKIIARLAGIETRLTMYVARHSWASAAKTKGIPVRVISEGMGHDSETTTRIYLASLDTSVVDRANSRILASL